MLIDDLPDDNTADTGAKRVRYEALAAKLLQKRLVADVWAAAFFWTLTEGDPLPPTQLDLRTLRGGGQPLSAAQLGRVVELVEQHRIFHWHLEFPEVFGEDGQGGFDCVLSNPPFGNAIETATARDPRFRKLAHLLFQPFSRGASDYCLYFWASGLQHLLKWDGRYGWLSPTALLSDLKPWQHWVHEHARPTSLRLNPVDAFSSARIRTTTYCGKRGKTTTVRVVDSDSGQQTISNECTWPPHLHSWYEVVTEVRGKLAGGSPATILRVSVSLDQLPLLLFAGCTTGVAYELATRVADEKEGIGAKLITTGAIDRYTCRCGRFDTIYIKRDYRYPRWPNEQDTNITRGVRSALSRQAAPKILIGGLTAVIEAWYDQLGEAAGVVSTLVVKLNDVGDDNKAWLLVPVFNSATFSRIYMERYGAKSMSGKQTTIQRAALLQMPLPKQVADEMMAPGIENRASPGLSSLEAQVSACRTVGRLLSSSALTDTERVLADKVGHLAVGLLYGRSDAEVVSDYSWWCEQSGSRPHPATTYELERFLAELMSKRGDNQ